MALRTRILISLVLLALVPLILFGLAAYVASTSSLLAVERNNLEGAVDSVSRALTDIQKAVGDITRDYSNWDDLHQQIADHAPSDSEFIKLNFDPESSAAVSNTYSLDVMGIWDADRKINYGYGPVEVVLPRLEKEYETVFNADNPTVTLESLGDDVYIVSLAPARDSKAENPNGFLAFGRKLSADDMAQIKALTGFDVALYKNEMAIATTQDIGVTPSPELLQKAADGEEVLDQSNEALSLAYSPIKTSDGRTIATIVIWKPRSATVAAQSSLAGTLLIGFLFGGILAVMVALALQRSITRPLISLANSADKLAAGDLTARVETADARDEVGRLGNAFNQMALKVGQRVNESETEKQRLVEMDEYRLKLLNAITEELQAPIDSIKSYAESLGAEMYGTLNEAQRRLVTAMDRSIAIQRAIVTDLMDLAKAQKGSLHIHRDRLMLDKLVEETIAIVQPRYVGKQIQFTTSFATGLPPVFSDRVRTTQILEHIFDWAATFSIQGGRVGLTATVETGNLRIAITDTSRGLTAEEREHVFDLFYRPNGMGELPTHNGKNGGNGTTTALNVTTKNATLQGLGLALAKALIEQQGGTISVQTDEGKGNLFIFTLPTTN
jgi:signal transduction histidine kinase/sensor domain CHASE-containing protein